MASLLDHSRLSEAAEQPAAGKRHTQQVVAPSPSAINEVMRGVGSMGVDDRLHGLSRRAPQDPRYAGNGALSALQWEAPEVGMDDPFAHARARPKAHPRDNGANMPAPPGGLPGTEDAANRSAAAAIDAQERQVFESLSRAHSLLSAAVAKAPRDASGALVDYHPLLALLASNNLRLGADAAGTLIATLDVQGAISFEQFMDVIAIGLQSDEPPPPAPPPQQEQQYIAQRHQAPPPPLAAPIVRAPRADPAALQSAKQAPMGSAFASYLPNYPHQPKPVDVHNILGGARVGSAAGNQELAALLNGGANHSRRSELTHTDGKTSQWR